MKRCLLALPAALALFVLNLPSTEAGGKDKAGKGEAGKDATGKTTITWYGQSFFIIKSSKGTRIAIDPHAIPDYYVEIPGLRADAVLMSHLHNDHTQKQVLANHKDKNFKVIPGLVNKGRGLTWNLVDEKIKDFRIRSVGNVYHDDSEGLQHGKNTIFILEVDGWRIVHLGDLGHRLSATHLKKNRPGGRAHDPGRWGVHAQRRPGQGGGRADQAARVRHPDALRQHTLRRLAADR